MAARPKVRGCTSRFAGWFAGGLALVLGLGTGVPGCVHRNPGGTVHGSIETEVDSAERPILILEDGKLLSLYPVTVQMRSDMPPMYVVYNVLSETQAAGTDPRVAWQLVQVPAERRLEWPDDRDILSLARAASAGHDRGRGAEPVRWIVGSDPVLVAIGERTVALGSEDMVAGMGGNFTPGLGYRFVHSEDLSERVTHAYVLERWPTVMPVPGTGGDPDKELAAIVAKDVRAMKLEPGTTIEQLIRRLEKK